MDYLLYSDSGAFVSDGVMSSGGNPACTGTGNMQENFTYSQGYTFCPSEDAVRWAVVAEAQGTNYEDEINTSTSSVSTLIIDDFNNGVNGWTTSGLSGISESGGIFTAYTGTTGAYMTLDVADFTATTYKYAIVKTRNINQSSNGYFYFYWIGTNCASWSSTCGFVGVNPINITNNGWHTYLFNLSADSEWSNTVTQVTLYPYYSTAGVNFSIDYVILVSDIPTTLYTPSFDGDQNWCDCRFGTGYFNIGGETAATTCCGDDAGEFKRTRQCSAICSSDSADDACCDDSTDCVYSSTCYTSGSYLSSVQGAVCLNGTWHNSTPVSANQSLYYPNLTSASTFKRIDNATPQLNITDIEDAKGIRYVFGNLTKPGGSLGQNALFLSAASIPNGSTFRYAGPSDGLVAAYSFEEGNQTYAFDLTNFSNTGTYYGETFNNGTLKYYENVIYNFDTPTQYYYEYQRADFASGDTPGANTSYYKQGDRGGQLQQDPAILHGHLPLREQRQRHQHAKQVR